MPHKKRYAKYSSKKYKKQQVLNSLFVYIVVLIMLAGTIFLANTFSNMLTIKTLSGLNVKATSNKQTVYAVSLLTTNNYSEAVNLSSILQQRLAAGYIFNKDNAFMVLTSAYPKKEQAESVKNKLQNSGENAQIFEITLPAITLNTTFTTTALGTITNSLGLFFKNFNTLQDISIEFDSAKLSFTETKMKIQDLINANHSQLEKFNNQFNSTSTPQIVYIKVFLNRLQKSVEELLNLESENALSSAIKQKYFECLQLYIDLEKEL